MPIDDFSKDIFSDTPSYVLNAVQVASFVFASTSARALLITLDMYFLQKKRRKYTK